MRTETLWTVTVTTVDQDDDLMPWLDLSPAERVDLVGECVLDGLRVRGAVWDFL